MRSAKERLHDVFRKGHPGSTGPDYRRALKVLADVIDDVDGRVDQISEEVEAKETDHDALSGLFGRYDEMIDDLRNRISGVDDRVERMDEKQNQAYDWIDDLGDWLSEVDDRLVDLEDEVEALKEGEYDYDAMAGLTGRLEERIDENAKRLEQAIKWIERLQDSMIDKARSIEELSQEVGDRKREVDGLDTRLERLEERLAPIRSELYRLADTHNELASLVTELESRLEDVEKEQGLQDRYLSDLRGQIADVEQTANDTDALLTDVLTELELEEEQWAPLRLGTGGSWGGWHEDEQEEGEDLPHARHRELAEDVRAVFSNADIAVRESDEQPGLDVEIDGVSYYVDPNRSVGQKVDGWKLERNHRAWLVEQALTFLERRVSDQ
jgi:predicted  nucleic acid-binding Zn-ribbon protein